MSQWIKSPRITSIDVLRGLVILFMLVDHTRERFFLYMPLGDPMDVQSISPGLFFSRLCAHLCAPIFVFLTGLSAWLYAHNRSDQRESVTSFLLKRGVFIVLLEVTVIALPWYGAFDTFFLQVMWVIGLSMISLSVLCKLPRVWIGILGGVIVAGHNLLSPITFQPQDWAHSFWTILHDRGFLISEGPVCIKISYPLLPWIGVILLGYYAGPLYAKNVQARIRQRALGHAGTACLLVLFIIRSVNVYGDEYPWSIQQSTLQSVMAFLNFTKYPPSLDFLLLTLGIGCFLLRGFERLPTTYTRVLTVYGSSPLFFYVVHLYVLWGIQSVCIALYGLNKGEYFGVDHVAQVWGIAAGVAALLYYPTKRFGVYKRDSTSGLIKYF